MRAPKRSPTPELPHDAWRDVSQYPGTGVLSPVPEPAERPLTRSHLRPSISELLNPLPSGWPHPAPRPDVDAGLSFSRTLPPIDADLPPPALYASFRREPPPSTIITPIEQHTVSRSSVLTDDIPIPALPPPIPPFSIPSSSSRPPPSLPSLQIPAREELALLLERAALRAETSTLGSN